MNTNTFDAMAALVVDQQGDIDLLVPQEWPEDPNHPVYFLVALFHKTQNDPTFYHRVIEEVKEHMKEFHQDKPPMH